MKYILLTILMCFAISAGAVSTLPIPLTDESIATDVGAAIQRYPNYDIYDWIQGQVHNGVVVLSGYAHTPWHRTAIEERVQKIHGVKRVQNDITVLPVSIRDDRLRRVVALKIYRHPVLSRYELGAHPSIHIIVDRGRVLLEGYVNSTVDQRLAELLIRETSAFGVTNNLQVEKE
jgi:osmotically-inducible protein OsmY